MTTSDDDLTGDIRYLSVQDLIGLNDTLINCTTPGELSGVLNNGGLESAQRRPSQVRYYEQTTDLLRLGAVLFTALIWNHPFHIIPFIMRTSERPSLRVASSCC